MKCNIWRLAVRYDIYIYIYTAIRRGKVKRLLQDFCGLRSGAILTATDYLERTIFVSAINEHRSQRGT